MKSKLKIKAQAMQFALLVAAVVGLLLGAFLMLTHVQSFFRIKSVELIQGVEALNKALLSNPVLEKEAPVVLSDQNTEEGIQASSEFHGAWTKTVARNQIKKRSITKSLFSGEQITPKTPNLYLIDSYSPLVVVGDTRIEGNSFLPKQGVKSGNISGHYYQGSSLYYGRALESKKELPPLNKEWIGYLESLSAVAPIDMSQLVELETDMKNSFFNPTQVVTESGNLFLGNHKIAGNIVIRSQTKIVVGAEATLEDVILIAPHIQIQNNVIGSFQAFATKKIEVGKNCQLYYPSALVLNDKNVISESTSPAQRKKSDFVIEERTLIEGCLVYLKNKNGKVARVKPHIQIAARVEIIGEVFCQGNVEHQGTVRGSLYTQQFVASQYGSVYLNHLYNGKVLKNPIEGYAGLPFGSNEKTIAKWLY